MAAWRNCQALAGGLPLGKRIGQHVPLAAAPEQIQHRAEHLYRSSSPGLGFLRVLSCCIDTRIAIQGDTYWVTTRSDTGPA